MNGRATGNEAGGARWPTERGVSHFMKVPAAVKLLRAQHGNANARKIALQEQQKARRARSRRRFEFWAAAAAQIEHELATPRTESHRSTGSSEIAEGKWGGPGKADAFRSRRRVLLQYHPG
jgi:hypothetical protein